MSSYDVLKTAWRLSPYSNGLRALLANLDRHRHHMSEGEVAQRLRPMVEAVMSRLGVNSDGEVVAGPRLGDDDPVRYAEAIDVMRVAPEYFGSASHMTRQWTGVRQGVYARLLEWSDIVIRRFDALSCPLYLRTGFVSKADHDRAFVMSETDIAYGDSPYHHGRAVELAHCLFDRELPVHSWNCIAHCGIETSKTLRLRLSWSNWVYDDRDINRYNAVGPPRPWHWEMEDWRGEDMSAPASEPIDPARYNFSQSPPGEREMLEKWYGIK